MGEKKKTNKKKLSTLVKQQLPESLYYQNILNLLNLFHHISYSWNLLN